MKYFIYFIVFCSLWVWQNPASIAQTQKPLTLEEAIRITFEHNPNLKSAQKEAESYQHRISQEKGWEDPQIGTRLYQVPWNGGLRDASDIDFIVSQKIPFPGKKKIAGKIAEQEYLHHLGQLNEKGRTLLKELKSNYIQLWVNERLSSLSQEWIHLLEGQLKSLNTQIALLKASALEALQTQMQITQLKAEQEDLKSRHTQLENNLKKILNLPKEGSLLLPKQLEIPHWKIKLEELRDVALLQNPEIKKSEHEVEQKRWKVKAARREFFPDLNTQFEYVYRPQGSEDAFTAEAMLNIPLWVGKKNKGVKQAEAELLSKEFGHTHIQNEVTNKVSNAYAQLKSSEKILSLKQGALITQSRQAFQMASQAYALGKINFQSLLDSVKTYFEMKQEALKSKETYWMSQFELEEAIGKSHEELSEILTKPIAAPGGT